VERRGSGTLRADHTGERHGRRRSDPADRRGIAALRPVSPWLLIPAAAVAIALGLTIVRLAWAGARGLAIVVLAIALAAALAPLVSLLERRMRRGLAVVVVYGAAAVFVFLLGWALVAPLQQQVQEFGDRAPQLSAAVQRQVSAILPDPQAQQLVSEVAGWAARLLPGAASALTSFAFDVLVLVFLSLYFLTVSPSIHRFLVTLFPRSQRPRASTVMCEMASEMGGYFRGTAIDAAIIGALSAAALWIIGVEFTIPLALLAAAGEFVPYIGPVIAAVPAIAVGLMHSTQQAITVGLAYLAIQQIESHIVTPTVMKSQTSVNPAMVIVALTIGYATGGILGAITAIPIFAAARVALLRVIAPTLRVAARRADTRRGGRRQGRAAA
jgi:predicted PurR-regulated permease PerM